MTTVVQIQKTIHNFARMKKVLLPLLFIVCGITSVFAQEIDKTLPEFSFNELEFAGQMHFLASDYLEGRRTGNRGNEIAGHYIAGRPELHPNG